jgi:hypothetical protein
MIDPVTLQDQPSDDQDERNQINRSKPIDEGQESIHNVRAIASKLDQVIGFNPAFVKMNW